MKNQKVFSNSGTIEDMVFENRNKAYGAYELNLKCRKYLIIALFICLLGASSAVAVPFLKAMNRVYHTGEINTGISVKLSPADRENPAPPVPPPPPKPEYLEKKAEYVAPEVVADGDEDAQIGIVEDIKATIDNTPVDIPIEIAKEDPVGIDEKAEVPFYVEESATFMGGGLTEFRKWVIQNITYPEDAIQNGIFGKVIVEFTVNTNGEVVNIKFLRSLDPIVDDETKRVISSSPLWNPAKQGGNPVKQRFILPILFQMQ
jgi:protein TonB